MKNHTTYLEQLGRTNGSGRGVILGYQGPDEAPTTDINPPRLGRIAEAFKSVPTDDWSISEQEYLVERREKRAVRRLCYAALGTVAGVASGAAGMAADSRTLRNAGIAVTLVSALYLIKKEAGYLIDRVKQRRGKTQLKTDADGWRHMDSPASFGRRERE